MKNIQGTTDNLTFFYESGEMAYKFCKKKYSCFWEESTYDEQGNELSYKNGDGFWEESTYNEQGGRLTYKNVHDYWEESTYDEQGNELSFKDSDGFTRGLDIPEYTMEELKEMLGKEFKLINKKVR